MPTINTIAQEIETVNALNERYRREGVAISQKAKYRWPNWVLASMLIPGVDRKNRAKSTEDMSAILARRGVLVSPKSLRRTIFSMINRYEAKARRSIGTECLEDVGLLGGIQIARRGTQLVFWFGKRNADVVAIRRSLRQNFRQFVTIASS